MVPGLQRPQDKPSPQARIRKGIRRGYEGDTEGDTKGDGWDLKIWIEIDEARLAANFHVLDRALAAGHSGSAPAPTLLAVVKANAYGHGIDATVPTLARTGAEWLGVTDAHEGVAVRRVLDQAGIARDRQPRVLIMSGAEITVTDAEAEATLTHALTPVVWTVEHLRALATCARRLGHSRPIPVHLEIDTGMARQGVQPGPDLAQLLDAITLPDSSIALDGVFTHFASTEVADSQQTRNQKSRFQAAIAQLQAAGCEHAGYELSDSGANSANTSKLRPNWLHVGNSSYLDNGADPSSLSWLCELAATLGARPMVRSGLALYGYLLPLEREAKGGVELDPQRPVVELVAPQVQPILAWKTRVIGLRQIAPGETVGYNGTFVAERPMRLALLPIGYADGLRRELSAANSASARHTGGWVVLQGHRAPIVGRVSMNLTVVDVTTVPSIELGDEATLLGDGITADDHARLAHTIAYEILCNLKTSP